MQRLIGVRLRGVMMRAMLMVVAVGVCACMPIQPANVSDSVTTPETGAAGTSLLVTLDSGTVEGEMAGDVRAFKGIPYAAPPVGEWRWRAPQPVAPWTEVRDATEFGADCMQVVSEGEPIQTTPSEDCLFVNVWTPAEATPDAQLPVLVWIHGGGFVGGGSSIPYYDGSAFARQGIVVVSLNYRLGRLGFFAHPALLAAGEGPVGNFGYMDQLAALAWVQRNVTAFGGDPSRVTLAGESAGGASVLTMLTSPVAEGLFHQVVIMSGGGRRSLVNRPMRDGTPQQPSADQMDALYAQSLGVTGADATALAALRALPAEALVGDLDLGTVLKGGLRCVIEEVMLPMPAADCVPVYQGTQMVDGEIVIGQPGEILQRGEGADVRVMIGSTASDLPLYFPPSVLNPYPYFGEDAERARAHYAVSPSTAQMLAAAGSPELAVILPALAMGTDITMHEASRFVAKEVTARGNAAWLYRFTYVAQSERPSFLGQGHAGELPFMFDTLEARYPGEVADEDRAIAQAFNLYVGNFVKMGDPNGDGLPVWPVFDASMYDLLDFTNDDGPIYGPDPRAEGVELIERAAARGE